MYTFGHKIPLEMGLGLTGTKGCNKDAILPKDNIMHVPSKYDYLIVGAGLFGAVVCHRLIKEGKRCLIIDKRDHIGGNTYCEDVRGINVHKYGAHIFHTSDKEVWDFVNKFVEFNRFTNSPLANFNGELYNLPFNLNTFRQLWKISTPQEAEAILSKQRAEVRQMLNGQEPYNLETQALSLVGRDIYNKLIKGYTEKQWGRPCSELPAFIIKRLPFRLVYDNNYFNDKYQGIPVNGYNELVSRLIDGADLKLNTDFFSHRHELVTIAEKIVYTGPLDEYFDFCYGHLQYRTIRLEHSLLEIPNFQGNAVVNYTDSETPYTRIIEHKHFQMFGDEVYSLPYTVISREYSDEWSPGMEPYYPVNDDNNNLLAEKYRELAKNEHNVIFGGRLADYRYYDMAPVIKLALSVRLS